MSNTNHHPTNTFSMNKLHLLLPAIATAILASMAACNSDDTWSEYEEWRQTNDQWFQSQLNLQESDGSLFYTRLAPQWDKTSYILIHYFNDRTLTEGNLSPLYTSTVNVKYIGRLYNGEPFDSSYVNTTYGDSIFQTKLSDVIAGWTIALEDMRVGDSARIVIPQGLAYGGSSQGIIQPYSALEFDIKLVDIPYYELPDPD